MRLCIIPGARQAIIKMSPVIRECKRLNLDFFILHMGQHYFAEGEVNVWIAGSHIPIYRRGNSNI